MPLFNPLVDLPESWQSPSLLNGWTNFANGYNSAGYWRDWFGVVHLRGYIRSGTAGSQIFTLPVGYRPSNRETFGVLSADSNGSAAFGRLDVLNNGQVFHVLGGTTAFWLDGVTFRVA